MPSFRLSTPAKVQLAAILTESDRKFGPGSRERYAAQMLQAMRDAAEDPCRHGTKGYAWGRWNARFYHMRHCESRVPDPPGAVGRPRHVVVFEPRPDGDIDILGFFFDGIPETLALRRILGDL